MNRYLIKETESTGIYERGDGYLLHLTIRDIIARTKSTPSDVTITIKNPCDSTLIDAVSMTNDETGIYYYDYTIPADAVYGKYEVTVSTATHTMSKTYNIHIFPWDANHDVRDVSGVGQNKSISDSALNKEIWNAYKETLESVFKYHEYEQPDYCRDVGDTSGSIDGTNKIFFTKYTNLADHNGDGAISGYGEQSCGTDVNGVWKDEDGFLNQCNITVSNAEGGKLLITRLDGTAIPSNSLGIYLKYHTATARFSEDLFRDAVNFLAAHKVLLRFGELERATAADLNSAQNIKYVDPKRMYKEYKRIIRMIRKPMISGV